MTKTLRALLAPALVAIALAGCATTSIMDPGFEKVSGNTYTVRIGTGGGILDQAMAAEKAALERLDEEAKGFIAKNPNYRSYQITKTERSNFPLTYYRSTIDFK